ncbi:MAG TPA: hypothetical protein VLQ46_03665 [Casimicrobiaceae bacterium]|nr:hypothetical protein [Casimicrobiaceae bacterium]
MIYVLTVHWKADFWVDAQISRLRKYLRDPFRIYAFCDRTQRDHAEKFDYCSPSKEFADHASKLNELAGIVCRTAEDSDVLIFCDSDAFPIQDITEYIASGLARWPLIAVQRLENAGDMQPHPCFCATTAGFWRRIGGDWRGGPTWTNVYGQVVTDVGAILLRSLQLNGVDWGKMLRSNQVNLHPLLFAVYDGVVYHHGAGSRRSIGGRVVRHGPLAQLESEEFVRRKAELKQEIRDASARVLDIIWRERDDELLALLC